MASLSRHSAKLSASLPCEWALAFAKAKGDHPFRNLLLFQCFGAVGWAAGRAPGLYNHGEGCGRGGVVSPDGVAPTRTAGASASIITPGSTKIQQNDQDGCEWVNVSSGTGLPGSRTKVR